MSESKTANQWIVDLQNDDYSVRLKACRALGEMSTTASIAVSMLTKVHLNDLDEYVRHFAKQALEKIQEALEAKERTVGQLMEELKSEDVADRLRAARTLGNMGAPASEAIAALTEIAGNDSDEYVRHFAKEAIGKIQQQPEETVHEGKTVREWAEDLKSSDYSVRLKAARTLGKISPPATAASPVLVKVMEYDSDEYVRFFAKQALDKIQLNY